MSVTTLVLHVPLKFTRSDHRRARRDRKQASSRTDKCVFVPFGLGLLSVSTKPLLDSTETVKLYLFYPGRVSCVR